MDREAINKAALAMHKEARGKIEINSTVKVESMEDLSLAYTPGVAEPCRKIHQNIDDVYQYTRKWNLVAVVSDGTAVLGLGDIGPEASMPVMEGKAVLFKSFGDVDAFPICLKTKNVDEIVATVEAISPTFGGINLEDISAPRCFEVERQLKEKLDIPVFHDDQHGTAIVVLASLVNALKLTGKAIGDVRVVVNGIGSAGTACAKLIMEAGVKDMILCDRQGILYDGMEGLSDAHAQMAAITNQGKLKGSLADALVGADVFIGVSAPGLVTADMVRTMNKDAIIFAMANPTPEIFPDEALAAGAAVVGTGRSDYANQINNVLAFPGIFRGALDVRATAINEEMKVAAAKAIADIAAKDGLRHDYIIPKPFDERVGEHVAEAVKKAARETNVARI